MKCPHCLTSFHSDFKPTGLGEDVTSRWELAVATCPACGRYVIRLREEYDRYGQISGVNHYHKKRIRNVYPVNESRSSLPASVPAEFAEDYREACEILSTSPKASAALSRRCLQHILHNKLEIKKANLADEIQSAIDTKSVSAHIAQSLDAVRIIGNFAAHPIKSKSTGEIIAVEAGEAEWNLDVIESLFDELFIQPAILQAKRDALNAKLRDAGKPEMK